MKRDGYLIAATAVVLIANALLLATASRNRAGEPEAAVVLTDRALIWQPIPDNSDVTLRLGHNRAEFGVDDASALGFDMSRKPGDKDAVAFYGRQGARAAFLALETDENAPAGTPTLKAVGIDRDAQALRRRFPDRARVLILPAEVGVRVWSRNGGTPSLHVAAFPANLFVHVSQPWSAKFIAGQASRYRVHVKTGRSLEPWVDRIEFIE